MCTGSSDRVRVNASVEDTEHILRCPSSSSLTIWQQSMDKLDIWLVAEHTCPDLRKMLLTALQQWKKGQRIIRPMEVESTHSIAVWKEQTNIGWRNILGGSLSKQWKQRQDKYYKEMGSKKSGTTWVKGLVIQLWQLSWDQWEDRNRRLHDTPLAEDLTGALSLNRAIRDEWSQGIENMPQRVKRKFGEDVGKILSQTLKKQKQWFTLVRSYREMVGTAEDDVFSPLNKKTKKMRQWVGLSIDDS